MRFVKCDSLSHTLIQLKEPSTHIWIPALLAGCSPVITWSPSPHHNNLIVHAALDTLSYSARQGRGIDSQSVRRRYSRQIKRREANFTFFHYLRGGVWIAKLLSGMIQLWDLNLLSPPLQAMGWKRTKRGRGGESVYVRESERRRSSIWYSSMWKWPTSCHLALKWISVFWCVEERGGGPPRCIWRGARLTWHG